MLTAILPMYAPMVAAIGIHFLLLLTGKTRYPRWMLAFHPVTWNLLLVVIPDIAQAMQVPAATWMSVMSQSSTNTSIVIWCIAAALYRRIEFSSKIERYRLANEGKENLGFTHLHFIDCGPHGQKSEDDLVFYVDLSEG